MIKIELLLQALFFGHPEKKLKAKKIRTQGKNSKLRLNAYKVGTFF